MTTTATAQAGANVRAEMARRSVRQVKIADHLGMSQAAISARLCGRTPFNINELAAIAKYLDIPLGVLTSTERAAS